MPFGSYTVPAALYIQAAHSALSVVHICADRMCTSLYRVTGLSQTQYKCSVPIHIWLPCRDYMELKM